MTSFETIMIICAVLIVLLLGTGFYLLCRGLATVITCQEETDSNLRDMDAGLDDRLAYISQRLDSIHDDVVDDSRDNRILDKLNELDKPPFNNPMDLPCYHPYGICTNPQMDCINCPRRGEGGQWTTTSNKIKEDKK